MSDFDSASNAASAVKFAMNPTPLGAAGLVMGLGSMFGGKDKKKSLIPGYENGQYINKVTGQPWDRANQLSVQGDQGK